MTGRWSRHVKPRTIARQVVLLVGISVVLFHVAMTAAMHSTLFGREERRLKPDIERFLEFARVLDAVPRAERDTVVAAMARAYPRLRLTLHETPSRAAEGAVGDAAAISELRRRLEPELNVFVPEGRPSSGSAWARSPVGVGLRDGTAVTGMLPLAGPNGPPAGALIAGSVGFMVLNLAVLLWWATRGLTGPLARFAEAAESFSLERDARPLPEHKGPSEVRVASRALNRMQERIRGMVEDRTRMLAAVSHDLRTPITRMRLRAEFIEDEDTRRQMLRDLEQMSAMVHAALSYLRDGQDAQSRSLVDLASLLQTLCHDFADTGESVRYEGPDHLVAQLRADDIRRAVTNLVENALKYGGARATVRLRPASKTEVEIAVIDEGPGIPDDRKSAMLEPFRRGDTARTMSDASAGFGLGLAIARSVAEAHDGELALRNTQPSGLVATLRLPIRAEQKHGSDRSAPPGATPALPLRAEHAST